MNKHVEYIGHKLFITGKHQHDAMVNDGDWFMVGTAHGMALGYVVATGNWAIMNALEDICKLCGRLQRRKELGK